MPTASPAQNDFEILVGAVGSEEERAQARVLLAELYAGPVESEALRFCPVLTNADVVRVTGAALEEVLALASKEQIDATEPLAKPLIRAVRSQIKALIGGRSLGHLFFLPDPSLQARWQRACSQLGENQVCARLRTGTARLGPASRLVLRVLLETGVGSTPEQIVEIVQRQHGQRLNLLEIAQARDEIRDLLSQALTTP